MLSLEERVQAIEERNRRVDLNKRWETSIERKLSILVLTYLTMILVMWRLDVARPWLNAIVPTLGFFLSTLTLPLLKKVWCKRVSREK